MKRRVFEIISRAEDGDRASRVFDISIMVLIALSVVAIVLQSSKGGRHALFLL